MNKKLLLIGCLFVFLVTACRKEPPALSSAHRKMIDTLVTEQTKLIRAELDSLCDLHFDRHVVRMRDSLIEIRFAEFLKRVGQ